MLWFRSSSSCVIFTADIREKEKWGPGSVNRGFRRCCNIEVYKNAQSNLVLDQNIAGRRDGQLPTL